MNELISYVDTRAAEVATDAIASDVAQVHQDMLDADADASAAAASAAAAAGTLANAVKKTGETSQSIAGDIAISGDTAVQGQLSVIGGCDLRAPVKIPVSPTNNDDAASKKYVDDSLDNYAAMVRTTGNITIDGVKTFLKEIVGFFRFRWYNSSGTNAGKWVKVASIPSNMLHFILIMDSRYDYTVLTGSNADMITKTHATTGNVQNIFRMVKESDNSYTLWYQIRSNYNAYYVRLLNAERYASELDVVPSTDTTYYDTPTAGVSYFDSQEMLQ